jgi:hypothetical protein
MPKDKVRVRIQSRNKGDLERLRRHLLKNHPQMILSKPREGNNPNYAGRQAWSCYGDYWFGKIRRRRGQ